MTVRKRPDKSRRGAQAAPDLRRGGTVCIQLPHGSRFHAAVRRTHGDEVRAAAIASTGQEVLELLHGGLRPQVLVLDALLTKPSVTQVLQEISTMQPDPEPAVLVLVPVPEETAARKALGLLPNAGSCCAPTG